MKKALSITMAITMCAALIPSVTNIQASADSSAPVIGFWSNEAGVQEKPIAANTTETYAAADRQWQGLPTLAVTAGGRMWCAWQTGDVIEGSDGPNNYDVMYYSDDMGETWSEEYMIWDVPDESIRLADPRLFTDQFGKLWLVLIRGGLKGAYAMEMKNPDCDNPSRNLQFGEPISWLKGPPAHRPTILSNGRWTTPVEVTAKEQVTYICNPDNENGRYAWRQVTQTPAVTAFPANKTFGESQIIELQDHRLMMVSRLPRTVGGGMEVSYSSDWGANWTPYQAGLGEPYQTPSSKMHIQRLESGAILMITHATTSGRYQLAAYLSYDDGKTYPYRMMLDDSEIGNDWGVSYPEAAAEQGEHGEIYIVYDAGRYDQKEIRMCTVTEEDIKAGKPVSQYCKMRTRVNELGGYRNFIDTETEYERYFTVEPNTTNESDILARLPEKVTLVDEDSGKLEVTGHWSCPAYAKGKEGVYTFSFLTELPKASQDRYSLLKAYVTVAERKEEPDPAPGGDEPSGGDENNGNQPSGEGDKKPSGGCAGGIALSGAIGLAAVAALLLIRKRKN